MIFTAGRKHQRCRLGVAFNAHHERRDAVLRDIFRLLGLIEPLHHLYHDEPAPSNSRSSRDKQKKSFVTRREYGRLHHHISNSSERPRGRYDFRELYRSPSRVKLAPRVRAQNHSLLFDGFKQSITVRIHFMPAT